MTEGYVFPDGFAVEYAVNELIAGGNARTHLTTRDKYLAKEAAKALRNRRERTGDNTTPMHGQIIITARVVGQWSTPHGVESLVDELNELWKRSGGNGITRGSDG